MIVFPVFFLNLVYSLLAKRLAGQSIPKMSYGVCLEVRGEIIRTVLCCIVYDSCAQS